MPGKSSWAARLAQLLALAVLAAASCTPAASPTPQPTAQTLRIQHTPALAPWSDQLYDCAVPITGLGLLVEERPAAALDMAQADVVLRFGPASSASPLAERFAAVLAQDELVLVVNPSNQTAGVTPEQAAGLFSGAVTNWQDLGGPDLQPEVWVYPTGDDLRQVFEAALLGGGAPTPRSFIAPDPAAVVEAVQENPGAVSYLLKSQVTDAVRILPLKDNPSALSEPVLAYTGSEPQGSLRKLLVCLQNP